MSYAWFSKWIYSMAEKSCVTVEIENMNGKFIADFSNGARIEADSKTGKVRYILGKSTSSNKDIISVENS